VDNLLLAFLGLILGGVVNLLADDLPAGKRLSLPKYPDGSRRPVAAWLGTSAFVFGLRRAPFVTTDTIKRDNVGNHVLTWRYPLVELALSALMTLTFSIARSMPALPAEKLLIWQTSVALFVLIAVVDLEHRQILLAPLLVIIALAIFGSLAFPQSPPSLASMTVGALCAGAVFSLVYLGGRLFAHLAAKRWPQPAKVTVFGRGDVYLMTVGGLIVGFPNALAAMALTILLGGAGALIYLVIKSALGGGYKPFSALPYGPFILAAVYFVMLFHIETQRLIFGP
jgi:hypothetical protein